jgi:Cys-rich protein (TIGR01571 family)
MNNYKRFNETNINRFNNLFGCFNNLCSFSMGCLFPQCLFGRIYELAGYGDCFTGCYKIWSMQFIINLLFSSICFFKEFNTLYEKEFDGLINNCSQYNECKNYNYTQIYDNNCSTNGTIICDCLKEPIVEKCEWDKNLTNTLYNLYEFLIIISIINISINLTINGIFYGHYRKKISKKYNILHNKKCDYWIHFFPCCHQLALCQEFNTLYRIELDPIYPINAF